MATNNLAIRKGQCINIGNCKKADAREIIEINIGDEFVCPECTGTLVEVKSKPFPKWIIYTIIAVAVLAVAGIVLFFVLSGGPTPMKRIIVE